MRIPHCDSPFSKAASRQGMVVLSAGVRSLFFFAAALLAPQAAESATLKPKFGDVDGAFFTDVADDREACRRAIQRKVTSCGQNVNFMTNTEDEKYSFCLPKFREQARQCAAHFDAQRWKCDGSGPARIDGFRQFFCELTKREASEGKLARPTAFLKPKFGDMDGAFFTDVADDREACRRAIQRKVAVCGQNVNFMTNTEDEKYSFCLPKFREQARQCAAHFDAQRWKCDGSGPTQIFDFPFSCESMKRVKLNERELARQEREQILEDRREMESRQLQGEARLHSEKLQTIHVQKRWDYEFHQKRMKTMDAERRRRLARERQLRQARERERQLRQARERERQLRQARERQARERAARESGRGNNHRCNKYRGGVGNMRSTMKIVSNLKMLFAFLGLLIFMGGCMESALRDAIRKGDAVAVIASLKAGADVNAKDKKGQTPLQLVVTFHNTANTSGVISALLKAGADVNAKDGDGWTPLHRAAVSKDPAVVAALLKAGADVNAKDGDGWTPLSRAMVSENSALVAALLKAGADVNAKDEKGRTPLGQAVESRNPAVVAALLKAGAGMTLGLRQVVLSLGGCGDWGHVEFFKTVTVAKVTRCLRFGANPNARDKEGYTPLHRAVMSFSGDQTAILALLKAGADVNARDVIDGNTPLHLAKSSDRALLAALLQAGANPNARNAEGFTFRRTNLKRQQEADAAALKAARERELKKRKAEAAEHEAALKRELEAKREREAAREREEQERREREAARQELERQAEQAERAARERARRAKETADSWNHTIQQLLKIQRLRQ